MPVPSNAYLSLVADKKRLGRAVKRVLDEAGDEGIDMAFLSIGTLRALKRAYDKAFAKPPLTPTGKMVLAAFRRNSRKKT